MFLKIVCLYVAVVCVFGAPPTDVVPLEKQQPTVIPIVEQSEELEANGTLHYSYETGNGIKREETSYDKVLPGARSAATSDDENEESNEIHVQQGSYSYTAPDGTVISVRYIADENGFRPIGDHLPKAPSILVAASPSRKSALRSKAADNAEGGSAPVASVNVAPKAIAAPSVIVPAAPAISEVSKSPKAPVVESRIPETSSAVQSPAPASESQKSSNIPEAPSSTEGSSTEPFASTTESASTTSESASTTIESGSTTTESGSTTPESTATTTETAPTTTESASSTTEQPSTSEVTSTELPTSTQAASTLDASSEPSTPEGVASTPATSTPNASPAESTPSSDTSSEAATTASA